jgi:hypothetical protein
MARALLAVGAGVSFVYQGQSPWLVGFHELRRAGAAPGPESSLWADPVPWTPAQQKEAIRRRAQGATLQDWPTATDVARFGIRRSISPRRGAAAGSSNSARTSPRPSNM